MLKQRQSQTFDLRPNNLRLTKLTEVWARCEMWGLQASSAHSSSLHPTETLTGSGQCGSGIDTTAHCNSSQSKDKFIRE